MYRLLAFIRFQLLLLLLLIRGWHSNRSCTLNCDLGQNFDQKILSWHYIDFTIVGFKAEISLDLDQFDCIHQRDIVA